MGQHIFSLNGIDKNTTMYSPTLTKVVVGADSKIITGKVGATDTECVLDGTSLSDIHIVAKQQPSE